DPRGPQVLAWAIESRPMFISGFHPAKDESDIAGFQRSAIRDTEAEKAWMEDFTALAEQQWERAAPDTKWLAGFARANIAISEATAVARSGATPDVANLRDKV